MQLLEKNYLIERLQFPSQRVQMWATYHLADRWKNDAVSFVEFLLDSHIEEIRESGVNLVGQQRLESFAFRLFRIFTSSTGSLRQAAVTALAELHYETFSTPLWLWFQERLTSNEYHPADLENAANGLLLLDEKPNWFKISEYAPIYYANHLKSLSLFKVLCRVISTPEQVYLLLNHYQHYRNQFTDPSFFEQFIQIFENSGLIEFLKTRQSYGYSVRLIYQECLTLLGWEISPNLSQQLLLLEESNLSILLLAQRLKSLFIDLEPVSLEAAFLEGFIPILEKWEDAIPKIQDQEYFFLISLPLLHFIKRTELRCMGAPEKNTDRIARIYHSPLLSPSFMKYVLTLLAESTQKTHLLKNKPPPPITELTKETLWKLVTHQIDQEHYPFPSVLPNPGGYSIEIAIKNLVSFCELHFEKWVKISRREHLVYALKLFRSRPSQQSTNLVLKHFTLLINQFFNETFEFIEYVPSQDFIEPLAHHYREGETDLNQLIQFIGSVHQVSVPSIKPFLEIATASPRTTVRILCSSCHNSYHYPIQTLYFDEECIDHRIPFKNNDLWVPEKLFCKNCNALLSFKSDDSFRSALYAEVLTLQLLNVREEERSALEMFRPLAFPKYFRKKTNPAIFIKKAEADLAADRLSSEERGLLLLELGILYLATESFEASRENLMECLKYLNNQPEALFHLGVIAFRQKNLFDARLHFSRIVSLYTTSDFTDDPKNFYELARHYLEILGHSEFKRSTFRLIRSSH